jgi:endonuclease/exonuclease/phosphatase family metal-dependent hydrolase
MLGMRSISNIVYFQNIHSLNDKLVEIDILTSPSDLSLRPAVLCFAETWLSPSARAPSITGYRLAACVSLSSHQGGLAVYVQSNVMAVERKAYAVHPATNATSALFVDVVLPHATRGFLLVVIYVSPRDQGSPQWMAICQRIAQLRHSSPVPLLIVGDFNARHADWLDSQSNRQGNVVANFIRLADLTILNTLHAPDVPTFPRSNSIIDLALTSHPSFVRHVRIPLQSGDVPVNDHSVDVPLSDHRALLVTLCKRHEAPAASGRPRRRWRLDRMDPALFAVICDDLFENFATMPLAELCRSTSVQRHIDELCCDFYARLSLAMEFCIPRPLIKNRGKPWFGYPGVREAIHQLRAAKRNYYRNKSNNARYVEYLRVRNWARDVVRDAKGKAWKDLCDRLDAGSSRKGVLNFAAFRRTLPNDLSVPCRLGPDTNAPLPTRTESVERIASFLAAVSGRPSAGSPMDPAVRQFMFDLPLILWKPSTPVHFSVDDILKARLKLARGKAAGPDEVPPGLLHVAPQSLLAAIARLFTLCYNAGTIPLSWKRANVALVYKRKGDPSDVSNYRPISITSAFARCFEHIILARVQPRILPKIHSLQFGFTPGKSSVDAVYRLVSRTLACLAGGSDLLVAFLDVLKAFDTVWVEAVLFKLYHHFGIDGADLRWLTAFLSGRQLRVVMHGLVSGWQRLFSGLPQGAVLSPLLFAVFINDFFEYVYRHTSGTIEAVLVADDISLQPTRFGKTGRSSMQVALDACTIYATDWKLVFSLPKSAVVHFHNHRVDEELPPYELAGMPLEQQPTYKYLGVLLHFRGRFQQHYQQMVLSAVRTSGLIQRVISRSGGIRTGVIRHLVLAVVHSSLTYCVSFLNLSDAKLDALDHIVARPLRRSLGLPLHADTRSVLVECAIPRMRHLVETLRHRFLSKIQISPPTHPSRSIMQAEIRRGAACAVSYLSAFHKNGLALSRWRIPLHALALNPVQLAMCLSFCNWSSMHTPLSSVRISPFFVLPLYLNTERRQISVYRCRFRFSLARLNHSLFRRHLVTSPFCPYCDREIESVEHVLLLCPVYGSFRFELFQSLSFYGLVPSLSLILGHVEDLPVPLRAPVLQITGQYLFHVVRLRSC